MLERRQPVRQNQHQVTEWYLRRFSYLAGASGPKLHTYSKRLRVFDTAYPARFLARTNDHSVEIERALAQIEGPAAAAADALAARAVALQPGLYAIGNEEDESAAEDPADIGTFDETRLVRLPRQIRLPRDVDALALAKFIALMFFQVAHCRGRIDPSRCSGTRGRHQRCSGLWH
jgi:hypothetical protein